MSHCAEFFLSPGVGEAAPLVASVTVRKLVGSKLQFAKACDAFVESENICGYLAAAMSAAKGPILKHPHIIGTKWGTICTTFCDELVDSVDQVSSDLAETNSDLEL